jgi:hypothetical protein
MTVALKYVLSTDSLHPLKVRFQMVSVFCVLERAGSGV